jgi:hypothetical protein
MAKNDIRPFRSPLGGSTGLSAYPLAASQTFEDGEPVVASSGALAEAGDDPSEILGIAAASSQGKTANGADGVRPTGTLIQVVTGENNQLFISDMFATDGAGTAAVPTQANAVGVQGGLTLTGGNWYVDTGAANAILEIESVLDADGFMLGDPAVPQVGAGVSVVFRLL